MSKQQQVDLTGEYKYNNNKLFKDKVTLLICQRVKEVDKKPSKFLLINQDKRGFEYVSSLYQVNKNSFVLDTNNSNMSKYKLNKSLYKLILSDYTGLIEELKS